MNKIEAILEWIIIVLAICIRMDNYSSGNLYFGIA